ncbi:Atrial natriuretic peptide receptor 1 [Hypsibius exemplaris]|uniref:guanylate cyclase n=1 Tax=Hypsibius exemplaris TaxID=2072580 RepID=A0A1W0WB21_HYPEX|nr:Atrial natriuretic peptide receptor 1 [Hypsibius exemplaris]
MGMTGGDYVYVGIELYNSNVWGVFDWKRNDSHSKEAKEAFRSLLVLSIDMGVTDETVNFWRRAVEESQKKYNYTMENPGKIDPVVTHFYDAIVLYANMVKSMTRKGQSFLNGVEFASFVGGYTFFSPVNGNVSFNNDSDRVFNFKMLSLNTDTGKFDTLLGFQGAINMSRSAVSVLGKIDWLGANHLPPNMPRCGFKGQDPVCVAERSAWRAGTLVAAIGVPVAAICLSALAVFICVRKYLKHHSDPFWWRILSFEMDFPADKLGGMSSKSLNKSILSSKNSQKTLEESKIKANKGVNDDESDTASVVSEVISGTAFYQGNAVSLRILPEPQRRVPPSLPKEAALVRSVLHTNVQKFLGVSVSDAGICEYIVGEPCQKGSLHDLLLNSTMALDWEFKHSLIKDIANGMTYLHGSTVVSHGFLDDNNCVIDGRFVLKVAGFGLPSLRDSSDLLPVVPNQSVERDYHSLLWRAPELLRRVMPPNGTQKGDVYSFAIVLQQIILRSDAYQQRAATQRRKSDNLGPKEVIFEVRKGMTPPLRPPVPMSACSKGLHLLMENCWEEDPLTRPTFFKIRTMAGKVIGKSGDNIVDYLIRQMENHAAELEHEVDKQMKQFMYERQRSADLLSVMLPKTVAEALTKGVTIMPETYEHTTVYFGDVAGFSEAIAQTTSPFGIVDILNGLYSVCDHVITQFDVFKVETVQDAYLIVSGLPVRNGARHIEEVSCMALALRRDVGTMKLDAAPGVTFKLRVGINSGSCVASVIGSKMPRYCLFGDTVNTASRMESHGEAGKIHLSDSAYQLLKDLPEYILVPRGVVNIKGKGPMETYWLIGKAG